MMTSQREKPKKKGGPNSLMGLEKKIVQNPLTKPKHRCWEYLEEDLELLWDGYRNFGLATIL